MVFDIFDSMFEIQIEKKGQNSVFRRWFLSLIDGFQ
jgi:hypothetical protein